MRFGRNTAPADEPAWDDPLAVSLEPSLGPTTAPRRELFVRHARKDGRVVAVLRAIDQGSSCVVEAEVCPYGSTQLVHAGPYTFSDGHQASVFVTEAVAALMYLGCDIQTH